MKIEMTADNFRYVNTNIQLALLSIFVQETIKNNMCIPKEGISKRPFSLTFWTPSFRYI